MSDDLIVAPDSTATADAKVQQTPVEREVSTIAFPYANLEDAMGIARAIFDQGGVPLSRDQIAVAMKAAVGSGSFSLKAGAARMFNLVANVGGKYQLTDIGQRALSSNEAEALAARRDAFLSVPLYKRTFTEFRNRALPPRPSGLEQAFVSFGVSPKQKDKARWAFEKSAQFAGFFSGGNDRLVEPVVQSRAQAILSKIAADNSESERALEKTSCASPTNATDDPLIRGMLDRLPAPGSVWDYDKRVRWLQIFASNLDMVYCVADESGQHPLIEIKKVFGVI